MFMIKASIKKQLDPRIVIGFVVSLFIFVILYITGSGTIPSMTVGLLGSILTVLITVRLDLQKTETKLLHALGFSQELYEDDWLHHILRQIAQNYFVIKSDAQVRPVYIEQLQMALQTCYRAIDELAKGIIFIENEEERIRLMIEAVREAKKSVKAVSHINIIWWVGELGVKFLEENRRAVERGVRVERVFITSEEMNAELLDLINKQLEFGVKVYVASEKNVPRSIRQNLVICDDVLITEPRFNLEGTTQGGIISTAEYDVSRVRKMWDRLLMFSREVHKADGDQSEDNAAA
jgi:hypothetical protein